MLSLEELGISSAKIKQFNTKGIYTADDLLKYLPRLHRDYGAPTTPILATSGAKCAMVIDVKTVEENKGTSSNGRGYTLVSMWGKEVSTGIGVSVKWFNPYIFNKVKLLKGLKVLIGGTFSNDNFGAKFDSPEILLSDVDAYTPVLPVYSKIKGMSDEFLLESINKALDAVKCKEVLPDYMIERFKVISEDDAIKRIHKPKSLKDVELAQNKFILNRLYNFASKSLDNSVGIHTKSVYKPLILNKTNAFIKSLPYELTEDQKKFIQSFIDKARKTRTNALIQGDVGSGKTVCAFLAMLTMVDNGYQAVLMAPTGVLARQHYEELKSYVEKLGVKVVYLGSDIKAKEKKEILRQIEDGSANLVIGTHSVISDNVKFNALGLTVVDEEHKFGVAQRDNLKTKASGGVHSISMSATPIPRTLAMVIYSNDMDVFTIKTKPKGRLDIKTSIMREPEKIYSFMNEEIKKGHQGYIVCPLIDKDEDSEVMAGVLSVDDIYKEVKKFLPGVNVGVVTGKMSEDEKSQIINDFKENKISILVATTIIEVGVNNPNATVITISNAERFGLAGLHQLRGRVGRNSLQSYCILRSEETSNKRLNTMRQTTNGFKIAEEDLKLRGTGDFLSNSQSGNNEDVSLVLKYPVLYNSVRRMLKEKRGIVDTMKILNCNPADGDVITDRTARISFYGELDSISNIYAKSRILNENNTVSHLMIGGVKVPFKEAGVFYLALWWQFLSENPAISNEILLFDEYDDGLDNGVANSAARVFRILKNYGMNGLKSNCKEFVSGINIARSASGASKDAFLTSDALVKDVIRKNKDKTRDQIMRLIEPYRTSDNISFLLKLASIRYDEFNQMVTPAYVQSELKKLYSEYIRSVTKSNDDNDIIV